jgi:hypothetical protein
MTGDTFDKALAQLDAMRQPKRPASVDIRAHILKEVQKVLARRRFDWDGARGLPIRPDVLELIVGLFTHDRFLHPGLAIDSETLQRCPVPTLALNPNGTVTIRFDNPDGRRLSLRFECALVVTYVKSLDEDQASIEGTIRFAIDPGSLIDFCELLDWIGPE